MPVLLPGNSIYQNQFNNLLSTFGIDDPDHLRFIFAKSGGVLSGSGVVHVLHPTFAPHDLDFYVLGAGLPLMLSFFLEIGYTILLSQDNANRDLKNYNACVIFTLIKANVGKTIHIVVPQVNAKDLSFAQPEATS